MALMFFIGDSITAGAWDNKGGWANRLTSNIMDKNIKSFVGEGEFFCLPYILGVFGNTIPDVLNRMESEINVRLGSEKDIQIVFLIGSNDSIYLVDKDMPLFSDEVFKNNLLDLIKKAQKTTNNIAFIGLPPVDDELLNPIPWTPSMAHMNKCVERFNGIIQNVCKEQNIPFCPMFEKWIALDNYKKYLSDGIHPNAKGHEFIADQVGKFLEV